MAEGPVGDNSLTMLLLRVLMVMHYWLLYRFGKEPPR